mmetsp:Transcript_24289/g.74963  ORF Transcript_24289/g.74963 Transcript_24289/m.74963 type:complete len:251 (-) Transcript_24289:363-1115(-)
MWELEDILEVLEGEAVVLVVVILGNVEFLRGNTRRLGALPAAGHVGGGGDAEVVHVVGVLLELAAELGLGDLRWCLLLGCESARVEVLLGGEFLGEGGARLGFAALEALLEVGGFSFDLGVFGSQQKAAFHGPHGLGEFAEQDVGLRFASERLELVGVDRQRSSAGLEGLAVLRQSHVARRRVRVDRGPRVGQGRDADRHVQGLLVPSQSALEVRSLEALVAEGLQLDDALLSPLRRSEVHQLYDDRRER